jgi:hypothetical protein
MCLVSLLPFNFKSNAEEAVWIWKVEGEEGEYHDLYLDKGEEIRFRVEREVFVDIGPVKAITEAPYSLFVTLKI